MRSGFLFIYRFIIISRAAGTKGGPDCMSSLLDNSSVSVAAESVDPPDNSTDGNTQHDRGDRERHVARPIGGDGKIHWSS